MKENGQQKISKHLLQAANELAALVQEPMTSDDAISKFLCILLGPMHKPQNGGKERELASLRQQPQKMRRQERVGKNEPRHNKQNGGARDGHASIPRHGNDRQRRNNRNRKGHGDNQVAASASMKAKSQMENGNRNEGGKNENHSNVQRRDRQESNKHRGITNARSDSPSKKQIHEEKRRKSRPKKNTNTEGAKQIEKPLASEK